MNRLNPQGDKAASVKIIFAPRGGSNEEKLSVTCRLRDYLCILGQTLQSFGVALALVLTVGDP